MSSHQFTPSIIPVMILPRRIILTLILFSSMVSGVLSIWTEEDEARRIAQIMAEEKRAYEAELSPSTQARYRQEIAKKFGYDGPPYGYRPDYDSQRPQSPYQPSYSQAEFGRSDNYRSDYRDYKDRPAHRRPSDTDTFSPRIQDQQSLAFSAPENEKKWCYYCASPLSALSKDMQQAMLKFMEYRRTTYPRDDPKAITSECINGRNVSRLLKHECLSQYCQTLVLTDHNQAASFVIRGCAENFGAVAPHVLEKRSENSCERLHDTLDIYECICKSKPFCHAGRRWFKGAGALYGTSLIILLILSLLFNLQ